MAENGCEMSFFTLRLLISVNTIVLVSTSIRFLLITLALVLVAAACGGDSPTVVVAPTQAPVATSTPTPLATSIPAAATATSEPSVEPTIEPSIPSTGEPTATTAPALKPTATSSPEPTAEPVDADSEFTLELLEPDDLEVITEESRIEVVGSTRVDAVITINDTVVEPDGDGLFSLGVDLEEGPNLIEIIASVASGEQLDLVLVVIYLP